MKEEEDDLFFTLAELEELNEIMRSTSEEQPSEPHDAELLYLSTMTTPKKIASRIERND